MAGDVTPYLNVNEFGGMFGRPLVASETLLVSTLLLPASAVLIRGAFERVGQEPPAVSDPMAKLVTFDLVKAAMAVPAEYTGYTQYERSTDDRVESGTLAAVANTLDFTDHHRVMLGLSAAVGPVYGGFEGFGGPDPFVGGSPYVDYIDGVTYGVVAVGPLP